MNASARQDLGLLNLAAAAGLEPTWRDVYGQVRHVEPDVLRRMLEVLGLDCSNPSETDESLRRLQKETHAADQHLVITNNDEAPVFPYSGSAAYTLTLEHGEVHHGMVSQVGPRRASIPRIGQPGYHHLAIGQTQFTVAVAPKHCPSLHELTGRQPASTWGIAAQVYSLHRDAAGSDFTALAMLAREAAATGASAVAISPVHAMFSADPQRYSPYSPSSRMFLNVAYIDPAAVLGAESVRQAVSRLGLESLYPQGAAQGSIDWSVEVPRRLAVLRSLFDLFMKQKPGHLMNRYLAFRREGAEALESHARYEALHADFCAALGPGNGWQDWPAELRDPHGPGVAAYAAQHETDIAFHAFLQWLADRGLSGAQQAAREAGMPVGLIADLAIGTDPRGSHAWSRQGEILVGASVGAPPDLYQRRGQNWGLTAFSPRALRQHAYAAFIHTVRAALAHAGGVRIDHIIGMARMWLIPAGADAADGVYLRYSLDDMLRLTALEAWRHKAIVVGENLGTVPAGFDQKLHQTGILGTSVLWFERDKGGEFAPPARWSTRAMATPTTHDLPTVAGWWRGRDVEWRQRLGQTRGRQVNQEWNQRQLEKKALWRALCRAGCVSSSDMGSPETVPHAEILSFVAKTPAPLFIVSLEDLLGIEEQPNFPGSSADDGTSPHPNWRQPLPVPVERLFDEPRVQRNIAAIKRARAQS
ncbi:MAG TPA: 4-alpha-glucanotransferase [Candidimonas sp.]|nr:4-alpha-glucanotransferase [Candidimonas sp.]